MGTPISEAELHRFVEGGLGEAARRRIDREVEADAELRKRVEQLRREYETILAVRDASQIQLPSTDEARVVSKLLGELTTKLDQDNEPEDRDAK